MNYPLVNRLHTIVEQQTKENVKLLAYELHKLVDTTNNSIPIKRIATLLGVEFESHSYEGSSLCGSLIVKRKSSGLEEFITIVRVDPNLDIAEKRKTIAELIWKLIANYDDKGYWLAISECKKDDLVSYFIGELLLPENEMKQYLKTYKSDKKVVEVIAQTYQVDVPFIKKYLGMLEKGK